MSSSEEEKIHRARSNNRQLLAQIQNLVEKYEGRWSNRLRGKFVFKWISSPMNLFFFLVLILHIVSLFFSDDFYVRRIVETVILLTLLSLNFIFYMIVKKRDYFHILRNVRHSILSLEDEQLSGLEDVSKIESHERIVAMIESAIEKYYSKSTNPLERTIRPLKSAVHGALYISALITLLVASIRYGVSRQDNAFARDWNRLFIVRLVYTLLAVCNLGLHLTVYFIYTLQNARVLTLFQTQQCSKSLKYIPEDLGNWTPGEPYSSESSSSSDDVVDDFDVEKGRGKLNIPKRHLSKSLIWSYFKALIFDKYPFFPRNRLFEYLGSITDLCCIDQHPVRETNPFAERILTFHDQEPATISLKRNNQDKLEFNESRWTEYLPQLKPLGLNFMLMREYGTPEEREKFTEYDEGLLKLAKVIGFSNTITKSFKRVHEIKSTDEKDVSLRETLIVKDLNSGKLQLLSRGDPEEILQNCEDYWDGNSIQKLTKGDIDNAIAMAQNWHDKQNFFCIGFSYKLVPDKYKALFERGRAGSVSKTVEIRAKRNSTGSDISHSEKPEEDDDTNTEFDEKDDLDVILKKLQEKEIFIGIVGLRHQPKLIAPLFVDQLDSSHIRFIFFSEENELRSKIFANKLGLDTDWNSFISLKDKKVRKKKKNKNMIQKLPEGISTIRDHIRDVDNVPLLVRLFIDANGESKEEMVSILKENGEVVMCIGSITKFANSSCFIRSDISFGYLLSSIEDESYEKVALDHGSDDSSSEASSSDRSFSTETKMSIEEFTHKYSSTNSIFDDLMHIPCTLVSRKSQSFVDILELVQLGRNTFLQTLSCLWFLFAIVMALCLNQLLTNILFVVPSLKTTHIIIIAGLMLPMLTFSLAFSPKHSHVMDLISDKIKPLKQSRKFRYTLYFLARSIPPTIVTLIIFTWTMVSIWDIPSSTADKIMFLLGAKTLSDAQLTPSNYVEALTFSQNTMAFFLVLYIVVASMNFNSRTRSIFKSNPFGNKVWLVCCIVVIVIQIAVFSIWERHNFSFFITIDYYMFILGFGWIFGQLILDFSVKNLDKQHYQSNQDILELNYNTKLGMHSPV